MLEPGILRISRDHCYTFATIAAPEVLREEMRARYLNQWRIGTILSVVLGGGAPALENYLHPCLSFSSDFGSLILNIPMQN